ncbi:hypothetical protein OSB04_027374 [Centaurea solstitialis]|uniref:non-specific serine/threonine protein kinase n=1 Tax=Centaurea solstitialis TaxID=347529 RepID=A0AA38SEI1_9ASTR|nr:hypothetical protein OSB04_027374 [Centaurea solstitialis]
MTWIYYFILITTSVASASATDTFFPNQTLKEGDTIISASGVFELGFFRLGNSSFRYLGIRYKSIPTADVVWVANRDLPLVDPTGMLKLNGTLQLLSVGNSLIWSAEPVTNTSRSTDLVAQLLDSGNLILKDATSGKRVIWQSFDHPGNTWLPGMKITTGFMGRISTNLTSWKSSNDPSRGSMMVLILDAGFPQLHIRHEKTGAMDRVGYWNGLGFSGMASLEPSSFNNFDFVSNGQEVYSRYTLANDSGVFTRMVLNEDGSFQLLVWMNRTQSWDVYITTLKNQSLYAFCGPYGSFNSNNSNRCRCLEGFEPKQPEEWSNEDWSNGCKHGKFMTSENGNNFKKFSNLKLPDLQGLSWSNLTMSLEECKSACNDTTNCTAYANIDIRGAGSGCLIWLDELMDIREAQPEDNSGQDIYIRMQKPDIIRDEKKKKKKKLPLKVIFSTVFSVLLLSFALILYAWRKKSHLKGKAFVNEDQKQDWELPLFSFSEIVKATDNFSINNKLGEGGFGAVYKGVVEEGGEIAVKRLSKTSSQGLVEFQNEVICIAKLQHRNLVKLLGYCVQGDEKMLVYEYMPNKSLDFFLFDKDNSVLLDWTQRYHIINGIARGLLYLHEDSRLRIIHRDLKASNILLDSNMNPKISDFGLARMFEEYETEANTNKVVGTLGYISPEYAAGGVFSVKSDVFSFGVLVLEIVSGKKNRGFFHQDQHDTLLGHAWRLYKESKLLELVDAALEDSWNVSEVLQSINVGLSCVQQHPEDRPSMSSVIHMLRGEGALPPPKQPRFFSDETESEVESTTLLIPKVSVSINEVTLTQLDKNGFGILKRRQYPTLTCILPSRTGFFNLTMSLEECENFCNVTDYCTAYANADIRDDGSGCIAWSQRPIDIREARLVDNLGQDMYVRMHNLDKIRKCITDSFTCVLCMYLLFYPHEDEMTTSFG